MKRIKDEHDDVNRWIISYADFITLLFAFFVILFSMSKLNDEKYEHLSDVMTGVFEGKEMTHSPITLKDFFAPLLDPENPEGASSKQDADSTLKAGELAYDLGQITSALEETTQAKLDHYRQNNQLSIKQAPHWVEITLDGRVLFATGSAEVTPEADTLLMELAKPLRETGVPVMVEGHTDNQPIEDGIYPSNWELSTARAGAVARYLSYGGIRPTLLSAVGYSEFHPRASNNDPEGRQLNRRVKLIVGDVAKRHQSLIR